MNLYRPGLHTSESDWTRKVIGPDGVESLEPASPVGGRNLMKASHSHSSPLRLHFVHMGRTSSPEMASESGKSDGEFGVTDKLFGTYISCVFGGNLDIQTAFVGVSDLSTQRLHQTCYAGGMNHIWKGRPRMAKYNTVELPSMTDRRYMDFWSTASGGKCSRSQPRVSWQFMKLCYGA